MNNTRILRIVLYATLIFSAGAITGVLVAPKFGRHFMRPPRPAEMSQEILHRLQRDLSLTPEQATKIRPLLEATGREMDSIRRETTQRVRARMTETNAQISQILTPTQRIEFQKMEAEHRKHLEHEGLRMRRKPLSPPADR